MRTRLRNPNGNPMIILPLLAGFLALFIGVMYLISPLFNYHREQVTVATLSDSTWVDSTTGRNSRKLSPELQHWRCHYEYLRLDGTVSKGSFDLQPGAELPDYENFQVRYLPRDRNQQRLTVGVTAWTEGKWFYSGSVLITIFVCLTFLVYYRRWKNADAAIRAYEDGLITEDQAMTEIVCTMF